MFIPVWGEVLGVEANPEDGQDLCCHGADILGQTNKLAIDSHWNPENRMVEALLQGLKSML